MEEPRIQQVDGGCPQGRRDQNGQHSHCQHGLPAGKTHGERNRTDGCLDSGFRKIGDHGKQPFFPVQGSACQAQQHTAAPAQETGGNEQQGGPQGMSGVRQLNGGPYEGEEKDLRGRPERVKASSRA